MVLRRGLAGLVMLSAAFAQSPTTFRLPAPARFVSAPSAVRLTRQETSAAQQLAAHPENAPEETWIFTDRVALQLNPETSVESLLAGRPLTLARTVESGLYVLQAPDATTAWIEAEALAQLPEVIAAFPVHHAPKTIGDGYASAPNDEFFRSQFPIGPCEIELGVIVPGQLVPGQWYLENRDPTTGEALGVDINVRSAWANNHGEGITVAVADTGVELQHRDLQQAVTGAPHFNFNTGMPDGSATRGGTFSAHGTSAASLIAGAANNLLGLSGVAPGSKVAAWVIFDSRGLPVSGEKLGDMFRHAGNEVAIQNHSWVPTGQAQHGPDALEEAGIANAWSQGRGGLGTVMIFAAGNGRLAGKYANDNGYASDPRSIGVTGVNPTGRATASAEPGASILVAAPTGDDEFGGLFAADLSGDAGANFLSFCPPYEYLADFRWGALGFKDTSAAAPQISGVAALMLSANPQLTARDVQQVLLLSASHADLADPDLQTNSAGLAVSHNVGFGIVDASEAVRLARNWSNRPPASRLARSFSGNLAIPDGGYGVEVTGELIPSEWAFIPGISGLGIQPDHSGPAWALSDIGRATNPPSESLEGRGALIERGDNSYAAKLATAVNAGAEFAVVYNQAIAGPNSCPGGDQLCVPSGLDFSPIPVVFVGRTAGLALRELFRTNSTARARIALNGAKLAVAVAEAWQCERVGVRLRTDFSVRGDLRITLTSPSGTTSILQRYNFDTAPGPADWTYWSTHHYFESSAGTWTLAVTDEAPGEGTGQILEATLILDGVALADSDHDGLDDSWELSRLATLAQSPKDDPDGDGYNNLRESLAGTDPLRDERPETPDIGFFNDERVRVSWPGKAGDQFRLHSADRLGNWNAVTAVPGRFPVTAAIVPLPAAAQGFFNVERSIEVSD